jgi:hypothetical protein
MNPIIENILNNFKRPLSKVIGIHYKNYRFLLPESVNKFRSSIKYRFNDISYDLYGWNDNTLIDIYPTYKNIVVKEDLPKSWIEYSKLLMNVTNIPNLKILIYNKRYNKFINVIDFNTDTSHNGLINQEINLRPVTKDWVKATGIKNYIMDDSIVDIIEKNNNILKSDISTELDDEEQELFNQRLSDGNTFERDIIDMLIQKHYMNFVKICESFEAKDSKKYNYTISEMRKGTPIIHQAVLHDPISKIYGCIDLLIRSDWISKIFKNFELEEPLINNNYYYVAIDIKFHRLQLNANGKTIRNEGMIKVFKSQIYIYNKALGYMQNYTPINAYVLGRGWMKTTIENGIQVIEKNRDPFDKLGVIDFKDKDNDIKIKSESALKWLSELKNNEFNELDPKYDHCYPNMKNSNCMSGKKRKRSIAEDNNELTLIGYIGVKNRKIAINNGIHSYNDENLTGGKLGLTGKTEKIINTLLENQRELNKPIQGDYIAPVEQDIEVFVDFEYMYSFDLDENIPYLCGIGYVNNKENVNIMTTVLDSVSLSSDVSSVSKSSLSDYVPKSKSLLSDYVPKSKSLLSDYVPKSKSLLSDYVPKSRSWKFQYVLLDDISIESRKKMCEDIIKILKNIKTTHIYTWSGVDKRLLMNEANKFNLSNEIREIEWIDMYKFCLDNYINFKDAKRYGLKEIGKVLYNNNLTNFYWKKNLSSSSTVGAKKHYFNNIKWNPINIIDYNETDCRMIYEILYNLRNFEICDL